MKKDCNGRSQACFTESVTISLSGRGNLLKWCHAQFYFSFWQIYIRAFKWYIICFKILFGRWLKEPKRLTENLSSDLKGTPLYCTRKMMLFYPYLLLSLCFMGMTSNVASLFVFAKQKFRRNFHRLLVILAVYDFMVSLFEYYLY